MTAKAPGLTEQDIADYLAATPAFFERHAELLSTIHLASPFGQRAVSLQERQMEMLRDRIKGLERKIVEMVRHGQDNSALHERLQRWTRALMLTADPADLPAVLVRDLQQQFLVPQAALRVWDVAPAHAGAAFARGVSEDTHIFATSLTQPYCGANAGFEAVRWLDEPTAAASIAMMPLRRSAADPAFGLLLLASPDATRYSADMATDLLSQIGDLASAALVRLLPSSS